MIANLIEKKWLWRTFHVVSPEGVFEVIYNGKGIGYEEIIVNGEVACRLLSHFWYVPKFDFLIGNLESQVNVRVWAWLQIRSFDLVINGETVYLED